MCRRWDNGYKLYLKCNKGNQLAERRYYSISNLCWRGGSSSCDGYLPLRERNYWDWLHIHVLGLAGGLREGFFVTLGMDTRGLKTIDLAISLTSVWEPRPTTRNSPLTRKSIKQIQLFKNKPFLSTKKNKLCDVRFSLPCKAAGWVLLPKGRSLLSILGHHPHPTPSPTPTPTTPMEVVWTQL